MAGSRSAPFPSSIVYTKTKGRLYGEPLTKVGPIHYSELGDFRVKMYWRTNDPEELQRLHKAVLKAVREPGTAETFLEIRAMLRARRKSLDPAKTDQVLKEKSVKAISEALSAHRAEVELIRSNLIRIS